jgi:hypothetical protein
VSNPAPSIEHDLDRALVEALELQDAVAARDRALDACAERIAELLADVKAAAGSLGVPLDEMPPGSTLRRVVIANRLLIAARDRLLSRMVDWRRVAMRIWRSRDVVAADRDHWRRVAETEIDGRSAALEDVAAMTEDRDAWERAAERERERADEEREGRRRALEMTGTALRLVASRTGAAKESP